MLKQMLFRGIPAVLSVVIWANCRQPEPEYMHLQGEAQGSTFSIVYKDSLSRDFSAPVDSMFRVIDHSMSLWDTSSIISRMNRNDTEARADGHMERVFQRSMEISALTGGAFDITVGPLVRTWGFSYKKNLPLPDSAQVDSLLKLVGYTNVMLVNGQLVKSNPAAEIDLNAIAQGYTVDLMAEFLEKQGIRHYMVEIGGEVRTAGVNDRGEAWQIGIDKPVAEGEKRAMQTVIPLSGKAMATSGSYRKFITRNGKKYSHAIDPVTGYPVQHNLLSVTVIAGNCMDADAFATACLVRGLEWSETFAKQQGLRLYLIYSDADNQLKTKEINN